MREQEDSPNVELRECPILIRSGVDFPAVKKSHDPVGKPAEKIHDPNGKLAEKSHDPVVKNRSKKVMTPS